MTVHPLSTSDSDSSDTHSYFISGPLYSISRVVHCKHNHWEMLQVSECQLYGVQLTNVLQNVSETYQFIRRGMRKKAPPRQMILQIQTQIAKQTSSCCGLWAWILYDEPGMTG
jgi:hypothetical protein